MIMSNHPIVHIEISAKDLEAAGTFYHNLFGWEMRQMPEMNYATFLTGDGSPGGGLNPVDEHYPPGTVIVYVNTDDIKDTLQKVEALGGQIVQPPQEIPGVGLFAFFKDPTGNMLALLEPVMQG
jgi:predicted enzyme related to lactoylglutathione lyase